MRVSFSIPFRKSHLISFGLWPGAFTIALADWASKVIRPRGRCPADPQHYGLPRDLLSLGSAVRNSMSHIRERRA